ncbi:mce related family protein, partial [Vibrio parahaemolyticus AQ3810]
KLRLNTEAYALVQ